MNQICLFQENVFEYPNHTENFRPDFPYPEYRFKQDLSNLKNPVYTMVRNAMIMLGLDSEHIDSKFWNPLKDYISPGMKVLIKPNLVFHKNQNPSAGLDCLITHPSVVAALIDYTLIALQGEGSIVVGDAPLQECKFRELMKLSGYQTMVEYYQSKDVNIVCCDFRHTKTYRNEDGVHLNQDSNDFDNGEGVLVQLGQESAFSDLPEENLSRLRVTDYNPSTIIEHHTHGRHEYMIAKEALAADIVINMPKPKTHRKAGVTIALKNLVGINTQKEFLPHHQNGSVAQGGDCYLHSNELLEVANSLYDEGNSLNYNKKYIEAAAALKEADRMHQQGKIKECGERYFEGSWYGNDTIWRTIYDLNRILLYADKNGVMRETIQRKQLIVADMIVAGHMEGPLMPTSFPTGVIAMGDNPFIFDRTVCTIMGFNYNDIPSLSKKHKGYIIDQYDEPVICSNCAKWNGRTLEEILVNSAFKFVPTTGWECVLGNKEKESLVKILESSGFSTIIFGAGDQGIDLFLYLNEKKSEVGLACFYDNDPKKWNDNFIAGYKCERPRRVSKAYNCVIAAKAENVNAIVENAITLGFEHIYSWDAANNKYLTWK